jgi:hypothetical protein
VNAGPHCVETGTLLGKAQVYADGAGSPMGLFQFGESLHGINLTKSDLGPTSPHKLQVYVNGHAAESSYCIESCKHPLKGEFFLINMPTRTHSIYIAIHLMLFCSFICE